MAKVLVRVDELLPGDCIDAADFNDGNTPEGWHWSTCSSHWGTPLADGETCECQRRNGLIRHDCRQHYNEAKHMFKVAHSYVDDQSGRLVAVEDSGILGDRGYIWPSVEVKILVHRS